MLSRASLIEKYDTKFFFLRNHVLQLLSELRIVKIHNQIFEHVIQGSHGSYWKSLLNVHLRFSSKNSIREDGFIIKAWKVVQLATWINLFLHFSQRQAFYFEPFITYELFFNNIRDEFSSPDLQHHVWEYMKYSRILAKFNFIAHIRFVQKQKLIDIVFFMNKHLLANAYRLLMCSTLPFVIFDVFC